MITHRAKLWWNPITNVSRAFCSCGWQGEKSFERVAAIADQARHLGEVGLDGSDDEVAGDVVGLVGVDEPHDLEDVAGAAVDLVAGVPVRFARDEGPKVGAGLVEELEAEAHRHGSGTVVGRSAGCCGDPSDCDVWPDGCLRVRFAG